MSERYIVIIHFGNKLIDIASCEYWEDSEYNTLKDENGSIVCFSNKQEAIDWVLDNVKKDLINYDSEYLIDIKNSIIDGNNREKYLINP